MTENMEIDVESEIFKSAYDDIDKIVDCYKGDIDSLNGNAISLSGMAAKEFMRHVDPILTSKKQTVPFSVYVFERPDSPIIGISIKTEEKDINFYFANKKIRCYIEYMENGERLIDTRICDIDDCEKILNNI